VTSDLRKAPGPFFPASRSQARQSISIEYYLNSPDEQTRLAERRATQERAASNMSSYMQEQSMRRGMSLVDTAPRDAGGAR